jgi:lipid-A-disaccharide synthase
LKYYIISGEASGDLHASNLIRELRKLDPSADFRCWGGDLVKQQGAELVKHYKETSYMGFLEVLTHLPSIFKNLSFCKKDLIQYNPDALILVDYPGFNLRIAEFAKIKLQPLNSKSYLPAGRLQTFYYISPQIWAWKQSRVHQIKRNIDKMITILPFEKDFYKKYDYNVEFVGHPLLDHINNYTKNQHSAPGIKQSTLPIIALLPGSRKQEISKMLSLMLKVIPLYPDYHFVIAAAPSISPEFYESFTKKLSTYNLRLTTVYNQTYELLAVSHAAIVTSGTATLETALFNVPEVVCYKGSYFSYLIARSFVKVKYISLVNLILNRKIVTELIQNDLTVENLKTELDKIINDNENRKKMLEEFTLLKTLLGSSGASAKTAKLIYSSLTNEKMNH